MKRNGLIKSLLLIGLIAAIIFSTVACSSQTNGTDLVTIQDQVPLAGKATAATAKETFNNGGDVSTTSLQEGSVTINTNLASKGIIGIQADVAGDQKLKVKVSQGDASVYYDIKQGDMIKVPMQMGNGTYSVELYQNISGSQYGKLFGENVSISMDNANNVYLFSNQIVDFEDSKNIPAVDTALIQNKKTDADKLSAIYDYVTQNISYDYNEISTVDSTYVPNVDKVLDSKKGICYDYAVVMASLLREAGIPAKLVMGYRSDSKDYHAWNQVLIGGSWVTVDATWDSVLKQNGQSFQMEKDPGLYSIEKEF